MMIGGARFAPKPPIAKPAPILCRGWLASDGGLKVAATFKILSPGATGIARRPLAACIFFEL
jgi:hypothetical protein